MIQMQGDAVERQRDAAGPAGRTLARRWRVMQLTGEHYGLYQHLVPLALACGRAGFDVVFAGPSGVFDGAIAEAGLHFVPVPFRRGFNPATHAYSLWRLVRTLRRERIDVLHSHSAIGGLLGRLAARLAGVPVSVYTSHGFHFHERMRRPAFLFFWSLERLAARTADFLFTQNEEDARVAIEGRFAPADRIAVVGNGVDLAHFDRQAVAPVTLARLRDELEIPPDAPVVIVVARPTRNKGIHDYFRVAGRVLAAHPTAWFLAVLPSMPGEPGDIREEIEHFAAVPRIRVLGYRHDVRELLALSSVYFIPSLFEGLSKTVIEAMAMSLPVVGYDVRGVRNLIRHGETGVVVEHGEWQRAADAVLALLRDPAEARAMGARARARATAIHDQEQAFDRQIEVIRRLIAVKADRAGTR